MIIQNAPQGIQLISEDDLEAAMLFERLHIAGDTSIIDSKGNIITITNLFVNSHQHDKATPIGGECVS